MAVSRAAARTSWRVVDIVVASVLGVAAGVVFWAWSAAWTPLANLLAFFAPLSGLLAGGWLFAGPLGGLVVRRPGAALFTELVAAAVEGVAGTHFGVSVLLWGLVQGLGAEAVFALFGYRRFGVPVAMLSGFGAGVAVGLMDDTFTSNVTWAFTWKAVYFGSACLSGVVLAGLGSWVLVRALARAGVLSAFAAGRVAREV